MPTVDEVFIFTGEGGTAVPQNVVRVRVDPSVTSIPIRSFYGRKKLIEVELCECLVQIEDDSFAWCGHSITKISIPTSLRRINDCAFNCSLRTPIRLHDGIESIGEGAFAACIFTNFRVPPLINVIPASMLSNCKSLLSLELPHTVMQIENYAFYHCYCLRNVAFAPNAVFGDDVFIDGGMNLITDLQRLFGSNARIIWELQHRFDGLPIHKLIYYQSYYQGVLLDLIAAINLRSGQRRTLRSKLDPTGNQQDCLGMTPLHILSCSSVHDIEVYRVIVEKYPTNLITKDRWGALPLLYAFWGAAPTEIAQFLIESYQLYYPDQVFNWTDMVWTMGRTDTPKESIENLLRVKQLHFPEQPLDWEYLLNKFAQPSRVSISGAPFQERMKFFFMCGLSSRVEALPFRDWRDHIEDMIPTANYKWDEDNLVILDGIRAKVSHLECELTKMKEATFILELALWKKRINDTNHQQKLSHHQKTNQTEGACIRQQCRVTCGAEFIIGHVVPYLINTVRPPQVEEITPQSSAMGGDDVDDREVDNDYHTSPWFVEHHEALLVLAITGFTAITVLAFRTRRSS
jgi:hypothetical protein